MNLTDLINKCKKKDRKSQERLYRMFSAKFFSLCLKYSGNYDLAKDNLQEGFLKIFENISQYNGKGSFEDWMTRIIINTALKEYKRNIVFSDYHDHLLEDPEEITVEEETIPTEFLIKIIEELPKQYNLVFNLYVFEEFSHKEIADILQISVSTSKSNLVRARQNLKEKIQDREYIFKRQAK